MENLVFTNNIWNHQVVTGGGKSFTMSQWSPTDWNNVASEKTEQEKDCDWRELINKS